MRPRHLPSSSVRATTRGCSSPRVAQPRSCAGPSCWDASSDTPRGARRTHQARDAVPPGPRLSRHLLGSREATRDATSTRRCGGRPNPAPVRPKERRCRTGDSSRTNHCVLGSPRCGGGLLGSRGTALEHRWGATPSTGSGQAHVAPAGAPGFAPTPCLVLDETRAFPDSARRAVRKRSRLPGSAGGSDGRGAARRAAPGPPPDGTARRRLAARRRRCRRWSCR